MLFVSCSVSAGGDALSAACFISQLPSPTTRAAVTGLSSPAPSLILCAASLSPERDISPPLFSSCGARESAGVGGCDEKARLCTEAQLFIGSGGGGALHTPASVSRPSIRQHPSADSAPHHTAVVFSSSELEGSGGSCGPVDGCWRMLTDAWLACLPASTHPQKMKMTSVRAESGEDVYRMLQCFMESVHELPLSQTRDLLNSGSRVVGICVLQRRLCCCCAAAVRMLPADGACA